MVPITVFTPAYNRADLLGRCYESMQRQTDKRFIWMIIDDGSTDTTRETVASWIAQTTDFEIQYYYKENGGLYTAYNEAIARIETELCVCIDSDDFMPDDAIEKILSFWEEHGCDDYAGIVGLDFDLDGKVIGDPLPDQKTVNLIDLLTGKYPLHNGDRTNVVRTALYKQVAPMEGFEGEKDFNPHYMHLQISLKYDFLVLNENLRFVDYQDGGMTSYIYKQYVRSPRSFAKTRKLYLSFPNTSFKFKMRQAIHLVSSGILAGDLFGTIADASHRMTVLLALPFGVVLTAYIKRKVKRL